MCTIYRTTAAPQRVFLCASSATSDRQFRYPNHPIRCSTATQSIHSAAITNTLPRGCCICQTKIYTEYQIKQTKTKIRLRLLLLIPLAKCKVAVSFKTISGQSLREDVRMLAFAGNKRDLDHTLRGQIPKRVVPHVDVLTPTRAKGILDKRNRSFFVLKDVDLTRLPTRPQELNHSVHKQSLLHTIAHRKILWFRSRL